MPGRPGRSISIFSGGKDSLAKWFDGAHHKMALEFDVVLRNTQGIAIAYIKNDCAAISWTCDALGGCGIAEIRLRRYFDNYGDIDLFYQVEIFEGVDMYRKGFGIEIGGGVFGGAPGTGVPLDAVFTPQGIELAGSRALRWSGFIREIVPVLGIREEVQLRCSGWCWQLEYVAVENKGSRQGPIALTAPADVCAVGRSIVDTYALPGTQIRRSFRRNRCQDTGVTNSATGLTFETSALEALKACAEIGGNCEYGVRADREIYFLPRSSAVKQTWTIGDRVQYFEPSKGSTDEVVHTVILAGNSGFRAVLNLVPPEAGYYLERTISVPSIANANEATLWGDAFAAKFSTAKSRGRLILAAIDVEKSGLSNWIERQPNQSMPPLGLLRVLGAPVFMRGGVQLAAMGGAQFGPGGIQLTAAVVGGTTDLSFRPQQIRYTPIDGGLKIEIDLGEKATGLADYLRSIEQKLSDLRQLAA